MVEYDDKDDAEEKKEDIQASQKERRKNIILGVLKSMALLILVSTIIFQTTFYTQISDHSRNFSSYLS